MKFNLKKVIASVAALAMSLSCFTAFAADFSDVEATASYKNAIDTLVALEVVNGYEDGTFKPEAEITRAEVTKMVVAAMGPSYTAAAESSVGASEFSDVKGHWAAGYISVGVAQKFINGMGDGTFAPDANVTYAQIVKMLVAALGYESAANIAGGYPNGYLQTGNQIGVTEGVAGVSADTNVTRAQVAQLIANALDTPLVVVSNWTTNILTGEPVAETKIMDGEEGRAYKTLLTEYHDAYVVKGRVANTKTTDPTLEKGKVQFDVEASKNFDKYAYEVYYENEIQYFDEVADGQDYNNDSDQLDTAVPLSVPVKKGYTSVDAFSGDIAVEDYLFTYAEAIIKKTADDDYELLTLVPYGKNEIVELASKDFAAYTPGSLGAPNTISFYLGESTSRSKPYKLDDAAEVYVNGRLVGSVASNYSAYIQTNKIGKVTLIDTPDAATTSKDGKFDYVLVTYQKYAIIDSTAVSGDDIKIYFDDVENGVLSAAPVIIDTTNDDKVYSFYKNGEAVAFEDLKSGDVVLMTYAPGVAPANSDYISFDICDEVIEDKVVGIKTKDSLPVYTVGGAEYSYTEDTSATPLLTPGTEYKFFLDAAGRIVRADELTTAKNFGIIDRVYKDSNGEEKVRIIKADGTRESFDVKTDDVRKLASAFAYNDNTKFDTTAVPATLDEIIYRAVSYKLNSAGVLIDVDDLIDSTRNASTGVRSDVDTNVSELVVGDYKESSMKVGGVYINDATYILDLSKFYTVASDNTTVTEGTYKAADIKVGSLSTFIDDEEYKLLAFDQNPTDKTYRFVVLLQGNAAITELTNFAVVDSYKTVEVDGMQRTAIFAYTADSKGELVELLISEDCTTAPGSFNRGDVVVFALDGNGEIEEFAGTGSKIFAPSSTIAATAATMFSKTGAALDTDPSGDGNFFVKTGITRWDGSTGRDYARVGFGIIMDKKGSTVTMAKAVQAGSTYAGVVDKDGNATAPTSTDWVTDESHFVDLSIAADANVYVYDYGQRNEAMLYAGSIVDTVVPASAVLKNGTNDFYNWTALSTSNVVKAPNYAFYKVVDGDITDIFVIVPAV